MWQVRRCCCFNLRTGSLIIAILCLISSAFYLGKSIVTLISTHELNPFPIFNITGEATEDDIHTREKINLGVGILIMLRLIMEVVLSALLLSGVHSRIPGRMVPWIVITFISWIVGVIFAHIILIVLCVLVHWALGLIVYVFLLLALLINGYYLLVVNSYKKVLEEEGTSRHGYV